MCFSSPKTAAPAPTPAPAPPPTAIAETVKSASSTPTTEAKKRTAGISSLIIRRPTVATGSKGTGSNVNY